MNFVTFNFCFHIRIDQINNILEPFRRPFWLEIKHWYVAYQSRRLFTVPYFAETSVTFPYYPPIHSTVPDDAIFFQHITHLQLVEDPMNDLHHLNHVKMLKLNAAISLINLQTLMDLTQIQHLILDERSDLSIVRAIATLTNSFTNLHKLSLQW